MKIIATDPIPLPRAFTLTELLAVMAIIGVLASMILPALARSKTNAQNAACINNLRQLGIAIRLYSDDNGYMMPTAEALPTHPTLPQRPVLRICDALSHYAWRAAGQTDSSLLFRCPCDRAYYFEVEGSSYRWNTTLNGQRIDLGETLRASGGSITNGEPWTPDTSVNHTSPATPMMVDYLPFHLRSHQSGKNAVYMDGHVNPLAPGY